MNKYWSDFLQTLSPYVAGEQPQDRFRAQLFEWYVGQIGIFSNSPRQRG